MSVIWGVPYLFIRVADRGLEPAVIVSGRTLIGALWCCSRWPPGRRPSARCCPRWRWLVAFAVIEMAVPWYLLTDAERHLPSALTGLLVAAVPLVGALIPLVGQHEDRITGMRAVGLGIGLAGVVALLGRRPRPRAAPAPGRWSRCSLVAVCYATGPVILSRRLAGLPGIGVSALSLSVAAALYLVPGHPAVAGRAPRRPARSGRSSCSGWSARRSRSSCSTTSSPRSGRAAPR